jgi:sensor histidine kinase YesM
MSIRKKGIRYSLRKKITLFILVVLSGLVLIMTAVFLRSREQIYEDNQSLLNSYANRLEDVLNNEIAEIMYNGISLSYNNAVIEGFQHYSEHGELNANAVGQLRRIVDSITVYNKNIEDIIFYDVERKPFFSKQEYDSSIYSRWNNKDVSYKKDISGTLYTLDTNDATSYKNSGPTFFYAIDVFLLNISGASRSTLGTLVFACNLNKSMDYLLDDTNMNVEIKSPETVLLSNRLDDSGEAAEIGSPAYTNIVRPLKYTDWVVSISQYKPLPLFGDYNALGFILFLMAYSLLSILGVFLIVKRNIQTPIAELLTELNVISDDQPSRRVSESSGIEIGTVSRHINHMLDRLENLTGENLKSQQKMYELEISKKEAELLALRFQINPHFLHNTLECIRGIALSVGNTPIQEIAVAMGNMFRYSIYGTDKVSVADEVAIIKDYFKILSIRHQGRYQLVVDIQEELLAHSIPKMLLQPIVENTVSHGLSEKSKGTVWVTGRLNKENIIFEIKDNGVAMEEEELNRLKDILEGASALQKRKQIGLVNIHQRIKYLYGNNFGITIDSQKGVGTSIKIILPHTSPFIK